MLLLSLTNSTVTTLNGTYGYIQALLVAHGYLAIIALMAIESASLPIPSEVLLPLIGFFVHNGTLNLYLALIATLIGTFIGISVDYFVAYYFGKAVVYKHAEFFHIKKETIENFDVWFNNNAAFTVFVARMLPVVRGLISFPAGFAQMDLKKFYFYSIMGSLVWNFALIEFGYYTLSANNGILTLAGIGIFIQLLYVVYHISFSKIKSQNKQKEKEKNSY